MIKILICDDEPIYLEYMEKVIKNRIAKSIYGDSGFLIVTESNGKNALEAIKKEAPRIIFLDVNMPGISGFEIADYLKKNTNTIIVFVSAYDTLVYTSIKFSPFRFVRKRKIKTELKEAIDAVLEELFFSNEYIAVKDERILFSDILYIESDKNYVRIVTETDESRMRSTLTEAEEMLSGKGFFRCHSAYIVSLRKVLTVNANEVVLKNGVRISVSEKYKKQFMEEYMKFMRI
jgi:DNA-binding LytR/AlgR family response regulator